MGLFIQPSGRALAGSRLLGVGGRQRRLNSSAADSQSSRCKVAASSPGVLGAGGERSTDTPPPATAGAQTGERPSPARMRTPLGRPPGAELERRKLETGTSGRPEESRVPGFLSGRERGGQGAAAAAMEKLRRVLSGQDDEEQGLTAQVASRPRGRARAGAGARSWATGRRPAPPGRVWGAIHVGVASLWSLRVLVSRRLSPTVALRPRFAARHPTPESPPDPAPPSPSLARYSAPAVDSEPAWRRDRRAGCPCCRSGNREAPPPLLAPGVKGGVSVSSLVEGGRLEGGKKPQIIEK